MVPTIDINRWLLEITRLPAQTVYAHACSKMLELSLIEKQDTLEEDADAGSAESWWDSIQRGRRVRLPPITWSEFSATFMDRFVPLRKRNDMRHQFEQLRQGTITITKYEVKFTKLATYAHFMVADEQENMRRFVDGLENRYRGPVVRDV
nr:uncharacterized protein LOC117280309 [Nicotiana tomentosiformis]